MRIILDQNNRAQQRVNARLGELLGPPSPEGPTTLHLSATSFRHAVEHGEELSHHVMIGEIIGDHLHELGDATGLEAVARQDRRSRFALVRARALHSSSADLISLMEGAIPTLRNWQQNQNRLLDVLADYTAWWMRRTRELGACSQVGPPRLLQLAHARRHSRRQAALCQSRWIYAGLARRCRIDKDSSWRISCGRLDGKRLVDLIHLKNDGADWFADPFLVEEGAHLWMFCERWSERDQRGVIDLIEVGPAGLKRHGTVLAEPFHLSFPRVFRHGGRWYATVESGDAAEIRLYEAVHFPQRWQLRRILLNGPWLDPLLIERAGEWYLLASLGSSAALPRETAPELHLFHSPDLLNLPFQRHLQSPLLIDSSGGRNGGLVHTPDGSLLRVAQQVDFGGGYGTGVEIRRITELNQKRYSEEPCHFDWLGELRRRLGASHLHSVSRSGDMVAVDWIRGR